MYVFGNGESRTSINIDNLDGPKIGCNAIHRDYYMDHLVCVDRRMAQEAINANIKSKIYTRTDWAPMFKGAVRTVPPLPYTGDRRWDEPFQWGSGPYAVLMASMYTTNKCVNLIGFDLWSKNKHVNNVYKDTPNYENADYRAVDPRYWIHQIGMVFKCFPNTQFIIYQEDWELPETWKYPNVTVDNISNISYNNN